MTHPAAVPVAEIERRLHWRWIGLAGFIVTPAVMAAVSLLVPPQRVVGLPADPQLDTVAAAPR